MPVDPAAVHELVVKAARADGVEEIETILTHSQQALPRFADNYIHQNVAETSSPLSVRPRIGGRTARASTNRLDEESIRRVVADAIALTRLTEPDEDSLPMAEAAAYRAVDRWSDATASITPAERANAVVEAIDVAEEAGQTVARCFFT